jgi:hypothetical protein
MAIDTEDAPCSPTCLFCGKTDGPFDVEDVFPKWTRRVLPVPMQTTQVRTTPDGVPVPSSAPTSTYLNAKLKDSVCRDCNNKWMSVLEGDAKPILGDMMNPTPATVPVVLDSQAQRTAAFWATEKAACVELSIRQSEASYSGNPLFPGELEWLYDHRDTRELPPYAQVWLFAFRAQAAGTDAALSGTHQSLALADSGSESQGAAGVLSTFTIGCLGFQVFRSAHLTAVPGADDGSGPKAPAPLLPPAWLGPVLVPISPAVSASATWLATGPQGVVEPSDLKRLITRLRSTT